MRNLSVLDVQRVLANLRNNHGVDLTHSHGMANLHGRLYPVLGMTMGISNSSSFRDEPSHSTTWHVPLENKRVITGSHFAYEGEEGSAPLYNVQIPGTFRQPLSRGRTREWSLSYETDNNRIGPVLAKGIPGKLDTEGRDVLPPSLVGTTFHDLVSHASKLPSNVGKHVDYYGVPGEIPFSEEDLRNFNLRDAIQTEVRHSIAMDLPKGAEHLISIQHIKDSKKPSDFYYYDPRTEQLLPSTYTERGWSAE